MRLTSSPGGATGAGAPDPGRTPVLDCAGLTKSFGARLAVDGVGFRIFEGEVYGLLGPNGAGKTTTMKMVCGLLEPDKGTITIAGQQAIGNLDVKALIGYVPQDVALYPDLTAGENLEFLARLYKLGRRTVAARVDEALELTELTDRRNDRLDSFSGGMKRRMNIAAGLLNHPKLLVLDEPTVGVDPQSRHAILERVQAFGREGLAVVYTTHYMEEAERVCDRVGIIDHGHLIAEGTGRRARGPARRAGPHLAQRHGRPRTPRRGLPRRHRGHQCRDGRELRSPRRRGWPPPPAGPLGGGRRGWHRSYERRRHRARPRGGVLEPDGHRVRE